MDCRQHSKRSSLCAFLFVLAAVPAFAAGEYRTVEVEALKITIDSEWAVRTAPGYVPVRFDITNLAEARTIEIRARGNRFFRGPHGGYAPNDFTVRQTVRLARGDRVRLTIPVPVYADSEGIWFQIYEGGRSLEHFNFAGFQSKVRPDDASALIVADPATTFGKTAAGWSRTITGPAFSASGAVLSGAVVMKGPGAVGSTTVRGGPAPAQPLDFVLPPARLPDNWLGFTSLRAVVIGPQEWDQLSDAQKAALLTWTACGGDLLFVDGGFDTLFPESQRVAAVSADRPARAYLFGRIHTPTSASVAAAGLGDVLTKAAVLQDASWSLPANRARDWGVIGARGFRLPIPGIEGVPARGYLFILIAFSLLIGPINYWLLRRARQQVLMVLTAPAISVVFIVLLAGYVVAGEGIGVRGRAVTFTMLDQARKQAATRASLSLYAAGMAPSGGLAFARDEAVFTIGSDGNGNRESHSLDLTDGQRFDTGVILARSPTNLEWIGFRAARARLNFEREGNAISVVNGLGSAVKVLVYHHGNTLYTIAGPLGSGAKGTLKAGAPRGVDVVPAGLPLTSRFEHLFEHVPEGAYVAVLERSPFWNAGVSRVDERNSFHVVIGWVGGQP